MNPIQDLAATPFYVKLLILLLGVILKWAWPRSTPPTEGSGPLARFLSTIRGFFQKNNTIHVQDLIREQLIQLLRYRPSSPEEKEQHDAAIRALQEQLD